MSFDALGLRPDADEREVRRAYARLLKSNRPDDDPVAFQALHEAYQDCLEQIRHARWDAEVEAMEAEGAAAQSVDLGQTPAQAHEPAPPAGVGRAPLPLPGERVEALPEPAAVPSDPHPGMPTGQDGERTESGQETTDAEYRQFDFSAFLAELFAQAEKGSAASLSAWLYAQPDLYSIQLKSAITVEVLRAVTAVDPPLSTDRLKVIGEFFGVHQLGPRDWWLVEQMELAQARGDLLQRFSTGNLPSRRGETATEIDEMMDRELSSPRWSWRMLVLTLVPQLPTRTRDRIDELDDLTQGQASALIEPRRREWFQALADRSQISGKRLGLSLLRTLLFGAVVLGGQAWLMERAYDDTLRNLVIGLGLFFLGWQLVVALYLQLRRYLERKGLGGYVREGMVLVYGAAALAAGATMKGFAAYAFSIAALGYAVTRSRMVPGGFLGIFMALSDAMLTSRPGMDWPFPSAVCGLVAAALLVLILDRIQSRHDRLPLELIAHESRWLGRMAATVFVLWVVGTLAVSVLGAVRAA